MFIIDEETGNITLRQGDYGKYNVIDLPTDKDDYVLYFNIQDEKRKSIGDELSVPLNGLDYAIIVLTGAYTNLLKVKNNEDTATYYFGVKICSASTGIEDTLLLGNSDIDTLNTITVLPKKVEGI